MTTTKTTLNTRLENLLDYIRNGRIIDAMHEFYDDSVTMTEPAYGDTVGLAANVTREQAFVDSVKEWKNFDVTATSVGDDVTMYESVMDWVNTDGDDIHVEQVAIARWKDGKIVHERFYYNIA